MAIDRGIVTWSGISTGPGYTVMYARPGGSFMTDVRTFFENLKSYIPNGVTLSFPGSGDTIDETTGLLTGTWTGAAISNVVGTGVAANAAGVGANVTWLTNGVVAGRRVRGRTFIVPLSLDAYENDGTLLTTFRNLLLGEAGALVTAGAGDFVVWHRPVGGAGGSAHDVVDRRVTDVVSVLGSRRR